MFDWLYERAGELKKYSFVSGGVCVAVNTVIGCVPKTATKTIGWIANLSSVVLSGEVYSALKNMEVAETITAKQQNVLEIKERLSLKRYAQQVSMESILRRLHFEEQDIAKLKDSVEKTEIDLKRAIPSARKYAYINAGIQLIPGIAIVVINSLANRKLLPRTIAVV